MGLSMVSGIDYSQYGEQEHISKALTAIGTDFSSAEFGAADGFFCSNTASLWTKGFTSTLIESDDVHFAKLLKNVGEMPNVTALNAKVVNVDDFVKDVVDVMSIDVDGNDYHIFDRMQVKHRIVCVEHNPTFPPEIFHVGKEDTMCGSSAKAICDLGISKGYLPFAVTTCNVLFMHSDYVDFDIDFDLDRDFDRSCLNYVVTDYLGGYSIRGILPYGMVEEKELV